MRLSTLWSSKCWAVLVSFHTSENLTTFIVIPLMCRAPKQQRRRRAPAEDSDADEGPADGASEQQGSALQPLVCSARTRPAPQTWCSRACSCVKFMSGCLGSLIKITGRCIQLGKRARAALESDHATATADASPWMTSLWTACRIQMRCKQASRISAWHKRKAFGFR